MMVYASDHHMKDVSIHYAVLRITASIYVSVVYTYTENKNVCEYPKIKGSYLFRFTRYMNRLTTQGWEFDPFMRIMVRIY